MKPRKWPVLFGKPKPSTDETPAPIADARHLVSARAATKALSTLLMVCLALGVVGFLLSGVTLLRPKRVATTAPTIVDTTVERGVAGEIAAQLVTAWLEASRDNHAALDAIMPNSSAAALPERAATVRQVRVVHVKDSGQAGVWSALIEVGFDGADGITRQGFFAVPVASDGRGARPVTLPAPAAGPVPAPGVAVAHQHMVSANSELAGSVGAFLQAFLTDRGEVGRYVAPGAVIDAPAAIYDQVKVTSISAASAPPSSPTDGQQITVLVQATISIGGQELPAAYTLTLQARAARWEVTAIDPSPVVSDSTTSPTPVPTRAQGATSTPRPTSTPTR